MAAFPDRRQMSSQPIIKLLTGCGIGSRRQIAALIKRGAIAVNGQMVESFNLPVDPAKDVITIDGKRISATAEPMTYLVLNKPGGVLSSTSDTRGERTVTDILPQKYRHLRLYPVGRLDKDSTGLMLLTNDGDLTLLLTHPRFEQEKEYVVRLEQALKPEEILRLEGGIHLDDGRTSPARVRALKQPPCSYSLTIHEGKKRQVRRMLAALGYRVLELKRIRLGSLRLGALPEGQVRELTSREVRLLKQDRKVRSRVNPNRDIPGPGAKPGHSRSVIGADNSIRRTSRSERSD
jgi:23S rRNA pseudouridine2605 synthase